MATYQPADLDAVWLRCPQCPWEGRGSQAVVPVDSAATCPKCGAVVEVVADAPVERWYETPDTIR
jgi:uncharacterized paraquat-inducible protein A